MPVWQLKVGLVLFAGVVASLSGTARADPAAAPAATRRVLDWLRADPDVALVSVDEKTAGHRIARVVRGGESVMCLLPFHDDSAPGAPARTPEPALCWREPEQDRDVMVRGTVRVDAKERAVGFRYAFVGARPELTRAWEVNFADQTRRPIGVGSLRRSLCPTGGSAGYCGISGQFERSQPTGPWAKLDVVAPAPAWVALLPDDVGGMIDDAGRSVVWIKDLEDTTDVLTIGVRRDGRWSFAEGVAVEDFTHTDVDDWRVTDELTGSPGVAFQVTGLNAGAAMAQYETWWKFFQPDGAGTLRLVGEIPVGWAWRIRNPVDGGPHAYHENTNVFHDMRVSGARCVELTLKKSSVACEPLNRCARRRHRLEPEEKVAGTWRLGDAGFGPGPCDRSGELDVRRIR